MALAVEQLYNGRNNRIDLILKADGVATDLSSVNKITASFRGTLVSSENSTAGAIRWSGGDYDTGEIRIVAGAEGIPTGEYSVPIIVYDATNTSGIQWGRVLIKVIEDEEAS